MNSIPSCFAPGRLKCENSLRPLTTPLRRAFFHPLFSSHSDRLHVARNNGKSVMQEWSTRTVTLVLGLGVIAVSSASILVRWNTEASGLTIAFYRMAWASVLLFPLYLRDRNSNPDCANASVGLRMLVLLAGCGLAFHFAFWTTALQHTSITVAVLLGNVTPILVALASRIFLKERLPLASALGILLTICGVGFLGVSDFQIGGSFKGPLFAMAGAVGLSIYILAGHVSLRLKSFWSYVYPTYLCATVILACVLLLSGERFIGFSFETHLLMLALAAGPQCIGHSSYNYCLKYLSPTLVSLLLLAEPIGASLLAFFLLNESLSGLSLVGFFLVGGGLFIVSRTTSPKTRSRPHYDVSLAIIRNGDLVYVQPRRDTGHLDGYWEFPGGKRQRGESLIETACREAHEECGVELNSASGVLVHTDSFSYPDRDLTLYFFCFPSDQEPIVSCGGRWVSRAELTKLDFPPANKTILRLLSSPNESC